MVKCGKFTMPASGPFSITGFGFKPRWIIFLFSNMNTEDTWLSGPSAGISWAAMRNSVVDDSGASIRTCQISEIWQGGAAAGSFLGDVTMWVRQTRGSDGWAAFVTSLDDDGFTATFASGFSSGAAGRIVYYLAGDEAYAEVGATLPFVPGSPAYSLGWRPEAFFGIGAGGNVGTPGGVQSFTLSDQSVPSACYGDWGEYTGEGFDMNSQWRGLLDPNVNVQEWWGYENGFSPITILEPTQSGGVWFSSDFSAVRTDDSYQGNVVDTGGFSEGKARMQPFILGSVDSIIGSFTPSPTVGVPTEIPLPFTPEAVVFFSPQDFRAGIGDTDVQGATGWGFCTADDQALLIYGGHWNPPTPFQSAILISDSKCWVSNCIDTPGAVGSNVAMGSARCTPAGFEYTLTENAAPALYPILYWAFAPKEEAPGFYRVLHR